MSPSLSEIASLIGGLPHGAAAPFWSAVGGAIISGLFVYFAARHTARAQQAVTTAQIQTGINDAFRTLMKEWQDRHSADIALVSDLRAQLLVEQAENVSLRGELRNSLQKLHHYENLPPS